MKITVTDEHAPVTDAYYIDCKAITVRGDIETVSFGPFQKNADEPHLFDLVQTLIRMCEAYPDNTFNPVQADYSDVAGFLGWFDTEHSDADSFYDEYPEVPYEFSSYASVAEVAKRFGGSAQKWPVEPLTGDTPAKYHSYEVFYHDLTGVRKPSLVEFG